MKEKNIKIICKIMMCFLIRIILFIPLIICNFIYLEFIGAHKVIKYCYNIRDDLEYKIKKLIAFMLICLIYFITSLLYIIDYWADFVRIDLKINNFDNIKEWFLYIWKTPCSIHEYFLKKYNQTLNEMGYEKTES